MEVDAPRKKTGESLIGLFDLIFSVKNRAAQEYAKKSGLQVEIYGKIEELKALYDVYEKNMI